MTTWDAHRRLRAAQARIAELDEANYSLRREVERLRREAQAWSQRADDADDLIRGLRDRLAQADSVVITRLRAQVSLKDDVIAALDTALMRSQREVEHLHRVHGPCIRRAELTRVSDDTATERGTA